MRTFTTKHTVYTFDELSEDAKQKAIERLSDINVDYDWWEHVYEDAMEIGLDITSFDLYRGDISGELTESLPEVVKNILQNHGNACGTWHVAQAYRHKHGYDNEELFSKELLQEYLSILAEEYEYLTSTEAIIETIEANEYEFYEDGRIA